MRKNGFTLIELLVVIAIIAILAAILFPVFARARENARKATCLSNCKQIGNAITMYTQDYDEYLPMCGGSGTGGWNRWHNNITPYTKNTQLYRCPSAKNTAQRGYGMNSNVSPWNTPRPLAAINAPADTSLLMDGAQCTQQVQNNNDPLDWLRWESTQTDYQVNFPTSWTGTGNTYAGWDSSGNQGRRPLARHMEGLCVVYCDGHAKWMNIKAFIGPLPTGWPYGDPRNSWDDR